MANSDGTIPLPPGSIKVWYDPTLEAEGQQPETTPIAHFESTPNDDCPTGSMLDVNASFVVYAVKNGLVRVLDRRSTLRTLLRGHETKVTDVAFFQNGDVLGTIGGNVLIWRIFTRESELTSEKLLEIPSDLPNICRLVWHPFNPNQFWVMHDNARGERTASLVETTRITTVPHESETHAVCQLSSDHVVMDGALQLGGGVNNLCWSGRDARHVLTAHEDGGIRLWDVKQLEQNVVETESPQPKCLVTIHQREGAVTRCFFLPHDGVVAVDASPQPPQSEQLTGPFVTATDKNSCITLWSPFFDGGVLPTKLAVFGFEQPSVGGCNLIPGFGQTPIGNKPPASFLLLSDRSEGRVFCVALKSAYDEQNRAVLEGFDYVVPFDIMYPIYSWAIMCGPAQNLDEDEDRTIGPLMDMQLYSVQSRAVQLLTLTHAMCVPPNAAWDESNPPEGIRVEALEVMPAPMATVNVTNNISGFEEDYELEEEEEAHFEEYGDDDVVPEASDLPSPTPALTSSNPFANWLGSIVGGKEGESEVPPSRATPESPGANKEEKQPPPPPPPTPIVATKSAPTRMPDDLPLPGMDAPVVARLSPSFLSPMELIQNAKPATGNDDLDSAAVALPMNRVEAKASSEQQRKKKTTPKKTRSRSPKPKKKPPTSNGGKKAAPPMPVPSADGKIAILKREDAPSSAAAAVPSSAKALDSANLDEVLKRALSAHFKKHESVMVNEIQRTVRAEVQSNVIPTLSKTITQTMEQSVVKPLQVAITKSSKESTKVRTQEVIDAVSGSVEEPLKDAFHESMKTVMIPAYESATRQMFSQISSRLDQGLSSQEASEGSFAKLLAEMSAKMESMSLVMQALSAEVTQLRSMVNASSGLGRPLDGMGAAPPSPPVDKMQTVRNDILALLNQQAYEAAFTKALSASTAEMAVFCCKNAELSDVLGGNSPALSQPILLCLMQQLGAVLVSSADSDLQTELAWLQEIALTLDPRDKSIHKHVAGVLQQLVASINQKMAQGDRALRRPLQMLLQVIRGMQ